MWEEIKHNLKENNHDQTGINNSFVKSLIVIDKLDIGSKNKSILNSWMLTNNYCVK